MGSIVKESLAASGLFEAEVLTALMLWRWDHPFKDDAEFRNSLLECAAVALRRAADGEQLFETVPASETNLIAAIYYAEWNAVTSGEEDPQGLRQKWLDSVRRALPSCFCAHEDLI